MEFLQKVNEPASREWLIVGGKFNGYYLCWWRNEWQHVGIYENETTAWGCSLFETRQSTDLSDKQIFKIAMERLA